MSDSDSNRARVRGSSADARLAWKMEGMLRIYQVPIHDQRKLAMNGEIIRVLSSIMNGLSSLKLRSASVRKIS